MLKPQPINEEIVLDLNKIIISKTDAKGIITYANDYFCEVSGYLRDELLGMPHNIVRHPDMPKVIFKFMWDRISNGKNIKAIVKNLAKDGRYYWVVTDFESRIDHSTGKIIEYTAYRMPAPTNAIKTITTLYSKLVEIENEKGMEVSAEYLRGYLAANNTTYDDFIEKFYEIDKNRTKIFQGLKRLFRQK